MVFFGKKETQWACQPSKGKGGSITRNENRGETNKTLYKKKPQRGTEIFSKDK